MDFSYPRVDCITQAPSENARFDHGLKLAPGKTPQHCLNSWVSSPHGLSIPFSANVEPPQKCRWLQQNRAPFLFRKVFRLGRPTVIESPKGVQNSTSTPNGPTHLALHFGLWTTRESGRWELSQ